MRNEEYWPDELTAWLSRLHDMKLAHALLHRELNKEIEPIYVRELPNCTYVLDGHHRVCAAIVYGTHLDVILAEEFEDCSHDDPRTREILEHQYPLVGESVVLPLTPPFERLIFDANEETLLYMRNYFTIESDHINEAMRRASGRLEAWVDLHL